MGLGRIKEIEAKIAALKTAPIETVTLAQVEKDDDVIKQSLRTKQAKSRYDFAFNAAGRDDAPSEVQNFKNAWIAHEAKLKEVKEEKGQAVRGREADGGVQAAPRDLRELPASDRAT